MNAPGFDSKNRKIFNFIKKKIICFQFSVKFLQT